MTPEALLQQDLELARRVHRTLLPQRLLTDRIDIDTRYREMDLLGGDYATVYQSGPDRYLVCICDVMGHGLAAALLAGRVNSFVRHALREDFEHPCQVVDDLNGFIWRNFHGLDVFVTFFCMEIDLARRQMQFAGCGHPPALLWSARARCCIQLRSQHLPIGVLAEFPEGCNIGTVPVGAGDRLLLYTDGAIEAHDRAGEQFGIERVESVLAGVDDEAESTHLLDATFAALDGFRHGEPADDVLVVGIRIL